MHRDGTDISYLKIYNLETRYKYFTLKVDLKIMFFLTRNGVLPKNTIYKRMFRYNQSSYS